MKNIIYISKKILSKYFPESLYLYIKETDTVDEKVEKEIMEKIYYCSLYFTYSPIYSNMDDIIQDVIVYFLNSPYSKFIYPLKKAESYKHFLHLIMTIINFKVTTELQKLYAKKRVQDIYFSELLSESSEIVYDDYYLESCLPLSYSDEPVDNIKDNSFWKKFTLNLMHIVLSSQHVKDKKIIAQRIYTLSVYYKLRAEGYNIKEIQQILKMKYKALESMRSNYLPIAQKAFLKTQKEMQI